MAKPMHRDVAATIDDEWLPDVRAWPWKN